jgi:hypothetical protein
VMEDGFGDKADVRCDSNRGSRRNEIVNRWVDSSGTGNWLVRFELFLAR